jgi:hypothetical protein
VNGERVAWTTRGGQALHWSAAVPLYTWADSIQALYPNGRGSDGDPGAPADGDHGDPLGVPLESYITGIFAAGQPIANGYYAPPGMESDVILPTVRTLAGNPFPSDDPIVKRGVHEFRFFKSPIEIELSPDGETPIFWVQGLTDALFTALEAVQIYNQVRSERPGYPIKLFLGDLGHDYAAERVDEWAYAHERMNAFLDYYLRPGSGAPAPVFDVTATVTRCLNHDDPKEAVTASDWRSLHPGRTSFVSAVPGFTTSEPAGAEGFATDPVSGATLATPFSYRGCRRMSPASTDANVASWSFALASSVVLLGAPVIALVYSTSAPDTELNVRLWDVAADGSVQGLVTRGTYRSLDGPGADLTARFQIAANGYRFAAGHLLKVEVAANDAPYHQASNVPAAVRVDRMEIVLPTR